MQQFWLDATRNKLYQNWWGGLATGLLLKGGLYDSSPMKTFLGNEFKGKTMHRGVNVGITNI